MIPSKIDGDGIARDIIGSLGGRPFPSGELVVISCSSSSASTVFISRKRVVAESLGIPFAVHVMPSDVSQADLERHVADVSRDSRVRAIILQLPFPAAIDRDAVISRIDPRKDIDNLTGQAPVESPSVLTVREILSRAGRTPADFENILVVGRGFLVGAPIIRWLASRGVSYSLLDIDTPDPESAIRSADLIISGVGKTGVVDLSAVSDGAGLIDFGFPPDADQASLAAHAHRFRFYTPTPHGTGPILVAKLFENFYRLS